MNDTETVEGATMVTATSLWPANIDTAGVLVILEPCTAGDVYQLICDRPNIKQVIVAGMQYSSQEIRNTPIQEQLGGNHQVVIENHQDPRQPVPTTIRAQTLHEHGLNLPELFAVQQRMLRVRADNQIRSEIYTATQERLLQQYPYYHPFTAPENPVTGQQAYPIWSGEIHIESDHYY